MGFERFEGPLSGIADIQVLDFEKSLRNDPYAHGSGHWDGGVLNYRYRPYADVSLSYDVRLDTG